MTIAVLQFCGFKRLLVLFHSYKHLINELHHKTTALVRTTPATKDAAMTSMVLLIACIALCCASVERMYRGIKEQNAILLRSELDEATGPNSVVTADLTRELFVECRTKGFLPGITTMLTHEATRDYLPFARKEPDPHWMLSSVHDLFIESSLEIRPNVAVMNSMSKQWQLFFQSMTTYGGFQWSRSRLYDSRLLHIYIAYYADQLGIEISAENLPLFQLIITEDLRLNKDYRDLFIDAKNYIKRHMESLTMQGAQYIARGIATQNQAALDCLGELDEKLVWMVVEMYAPLFRHVLQPETKSENKNAWIALSYFGRQLEESLEYKRIRR